MPDMLPLDQAIGSGRERKNRKLPKLSCHHWIIIFSWPERDVGDLPRIESGPRDGKRSDIKIQVHVRVPT